MHLRSFFKKKFVRNVIIVASGTAGAQIITMGFSPFITRLYGPEAFGVLGTFIAILAILTPIAALTYPIAIVLPKDDKDAKMVAYLSVKLSMFISVITFLILLLCDDWLVKKLSLQEIQSLLYLIPIAMFFSSCQQVQTQWLIRKKQFHITAKVSVLQAIIMNVAKASIGYFYALSSVLISLTVIGYAVNFILLKIGVKGENEDISIIELNKTKFREQAKRYKDFPLYRAPQVALNALSQSLPILMLASFFGPASAGFYSIGRTVLGIPSILIGKSIGDVFYPRISEAINNRENPTPLLIKSTLLLSMIGILPFGLVIAFGPFLFGFIFGSDWVVAGEYARWLALWSYFGFLNRPTIAAISALKLQKFFLLYEVISVLLRGSSLFLGFWVYGSDTISVVLFSISGVLLNVFLIFYTLNKSKSIYR